MEEYKQLLSKVLEKKPLIQAIDEILKSEKGCLNLVTSKWKEDLENNILFQDFKEKRIPFGKEYTTANYVLQRPSKKLVVLVLGTFTVHDNNFTCVSCPPLVDVANAYLASGEEVTIAENFPLYIDRCNPIDCSDCKEAYEFYNYKTKVDKNNQEIPEWCIAKTLSYNGKTVNQNFRQRILNGYRGGDHPIILKVTIGCRYVYEDQITKVKTGKIGGQVGRLIIFREENLAKTTQANLDNLLPPPSSNVKSNEEEIISSVEVSNVEKIPESVESVESAESVAPEISGVKVCEDAKKTITSRITQAMAIVECIPNKAKRPLQERQYEYEAKRIKMDDDVPAFLTQL